MQIQIDDKFGSHGVQFLPHLKTQFRQPSFIPHRAAIADNQMQQRAAMCPGCNESTTFIFHYQQERSRSGSPSSSWLNGQHEPNNNSTKMGGPLRYSSQ
ncbi:hypothetical protein ACLOJK_034717 [Asimina triloba]